MARIIIDANKAIFGRLCSFAAKKALQGDEVIIVNCEKAIITGNKKNIIEKYKELRTKASSSLKGPKHIRTPYRMLKRGIRGMLPDFRRGQGKQALSRIKCHDSVPAELEGQKMIKSGRVKLKKHIELRELVEKL